MSDEEKKITDADLKKLLPKGHTLPKGLAARADLLYNVEKEYKEKNKEVSNIEAFTTKLEQWFIQELPAEETEGKEASGVAGKVARVQIKRKEVPAVENWDAFYKYIKKNDAFELLNRAPNAKSISERWANKKVIPGVGKFVRKTVSLTKVK